MGVSLQGLLSLLWLLKGGAVSGWGLSEELSLWQSRHWLPSTLCLKCQADYQQKLIGLAFSTVGVWIVEMSIAVWKEDVFMSKMIIIFCWCHNNFVASLGGIQHTMTGAFGVWNLVRSVVRASCQPLFEWLAAVRVVRALNPIKPHHSVTLLYLLLRQNSVLTHHGVAWRSAESLGSDLSLWSNS
jgi:hypothetical protein